MKIKRVKWKDHTILGNLELDFLNTNTNAPYNNIIFAGENGTGKTSILESISTFLNYGTFEYFEYIEYVTPDGTVLKAIPPNVQLPKTFYDILGANGIKTPMYFDRSNNPIRLGTEHTDIRNDGCIFSKARADYATQQIGGTTTKTLDIDSHDNDSEENFTSLKQLIVDIDSQDNAEFAEKAKRDASANIQWSTYYPSSKIYRFKNAFDSFFEKIKYDRVTNIGPEKAIIFKKNNKEISIDNLSTGEKQIVFRGAYLLKNSGKLNGAIILIDEPELSMHPKWQKKILKYYTDLFTSVGTQNAQLFFATHSVQVLENALSDKVNNLVIVLNENAGVITPKKIDNPGVLPTITVAETNYLAFDIVSNDYHIELYGWLQDKESKEKIKYCDDFIKSHPMYIVSKHHKASNYGSTTYDTVCSYIRNAIHHPDSGNTFTEDELRTSIELLIELCR